MSIYTIYKATNIVTNQSYIGFDSNWPSRKKQHIALSNSKNISEYCKVKSKNYFARALKKYTSEKFIWEILYQSKDKNHCLNVMEPFFINQYNSYNDGYNQTTGGEGSFGKAVSNKNKKLLSKRQKENNAKSRWYNDGTINTFSMTHPGDGWAFGRINQKPTTKGNKWYNNGKEQLLCKVKPNGWVPGMLSRKHKS